MLEILDNMEGIVMFPHTHGRFQQPEGRILPFPITSSSRKYVPLNEDPAFRLRSVKDHCICRVLLAKVPWYLDVSTWEIMCRIERAQSTEEAYAIVEELRKRYPQGFYPPEPDWFSEY